MAKPTIFALSSGAPPAAISIIRISGPAARQALAAFGGPAKPLPRRAKLVALKHPDDGDLLDHALTLFFPAHGSVTGEDLVEFHVHGSRAVVTAVLDALNSLEGLEAAAPGGFTRQAFDNGRMDLTQVEGLSDLLASETSVQRRQALRQSEGQLGRLAQHWREKLLAAAARVAATLDFADEEDVDDAFLCEAKRIAAAVGQDMANLLAVPSADRLRDGVRVVLAGPPNSGKSSLINYLARRDIAIVTDISGTTRDLLEAPVSIAGVPFILIDSAGIRDASDPIEQEGIKRARQAAVTADIVLAFDGLAVAADVDPIPVSSKADMSGQAGGWHKDVLHLSAMDGRGIETLIDEILDRSRRLVPLHGLSLSNKRQRECVETAQSALASIVEEQDGLLVDVHIRQALAALAALVGQTNVEDMLDALFRQFCIGK